MNKEDKQKLMATDNSTGATRGEKRWVRNGEQVKYMVMKGDLNLRSKHTVQYTDDVS